MGGFIFCSRTLTDVLLILFFRALGFWMSKDGTGKVILGEWGCLFFISRTLNNVLLFLFFRASGFWMSKYGTGKVILGNGWFRFLFKNVN